MKNKKGFTLIEVIAVISIMGLIITIAVPKINDYIYSKRKDTFITNAKNIARQLEYENIDFKNFLSNNLINLDIKNLNSNDFDLENSTAYVQDNEIYVNLVGKGKYEGMYVCRVNYNKKEVNVQENSCDDNIEQYIKIYMELNGGSTKQVFENKYKTGDIIDIENPIKENATFIKWEVVKGNSTIDGNKLTVGSKNTIIYATWEVWPSLEVDLDGGTDTIDYKEKYKSGTVIELEVPTKTGYTFTGWTSTSGEVSGNTFTMGNDDAVITANWQINTYEITYNYQNNLAFSNGQSANTGYTINWDENFTITEKIKISSIGSRYLVIGNYSESDKNALNIEITTAGALRVYFGVGGVDISKGTITANEDVLISFSWNALTNTYSISAKGNVTNISYNGTYDMTGKSANTLKIGMVDYCGSSVFGNIVVSLLTISEKKLYGSTVSVGNPVRTGYTFTGWGVSGEGATLSGTNLTVGANNVTLTANWKANTNTAYIVKHWTQNLGAETTQNSTNYTVNSTENKTGTTDTSVTPNVKTITGFTSPNTQTKTILADGSLVINYYYTRNSYTYTLGSNTGVSTSGSTTSGSYQYGATITLKASATAGYTWSKWTSSNTSLVGDKIAANTTFTMPVGNVTMTPNVTANTYTISYNLNGGTSGSSAPASGTYGSTVEISNPSRTGYTFTGWTVSGTGASISGTNLTIGTSDIQLTASWRYNQPYLFNVGNQYTSLTGGWTSAFSSGSWYETKGSASIGSTIHLSADCYHCRIFARTKNKVDVTNYNQLVFVTQDANGSSGNYANIKNFGLCSGSNWGDSAYYVSGSLGVDSQKGTFTLNISSVTGSYYICASSAGVWSDVWIEKVYLK